MKGSGPAWGCSGAHSVLSEKGQFRRESIQNPASVPSPSRRFLSETSAWLTLT